MSNRRIKVSFFFGQIPEEEQGFVELPFVLSTGEVVILEYQKDPYTLSANSATAEPEHG